MKKFIGLNWKMNPVSFREAKMLVHIAKKIKKHKAAIFPPFVFIAEIRFPLGNRISIGAQDFYYETKGAFTGEVSLPMLKSLGVKYVLIGHSERRAMGEMNAIIAKKLKAALVAGMIPLLCVGEPWSVRKKGRQAAEAYVKRQLKEAFKRIRLSKGSRAPIVAYEPIWAIGTGRACSVFDAVKMSKFIKGTIKVPPSKGKMTSIVLYGGSVDAKNVNSFLAQKEIDGALVGGASADLKKLRELAKVL